VAYHGDTLPKITSESIGLKLGGQEVVCSNLGSLAGAATKPVRDPEKPENRLGHDRLTTVARHTRSTAKEHADGQTEPNLDFGVGSRE